MNFSVIRGADTILGKACALELAQQKRHILLLGEDISVLEHLSDDIRRQWQVHVHYFETDDSDTGRIISVCDEINANFEVDLLVNYTEAALDQKLEEYDVFQLDKQLKISAAGVLYAHQLLPNLRLHGQAFVFDLGCISNSLLK